MSATQSPATSRKKKWLLAAASTVAAVSTVAGLELTLAFLGVGELDAGEDPFFDFEAVTGLYERVGPVYRTRGAKLGLFNAQEFAANKPANTYRVFALGGSTTFGRPYDWRVSFGHWMAEFLRAARTGHEVEVINAGGVSYASYRVKVLMTELLQYQPDLFVVYTGQNEFLEERVYGDRLRENALLKMARRNLSGLRTVRWLRGLISDPPAVAARGQQKLATEVKTRLDVWDGMNAFVRDDELRRDVVEHFGWNVEAMIRMARQHQVPIVFVAPASNLRGFSPFKSQHREGLGSADLQAFDAALASARVAIAAGQSDAALSSLQHALAIDSSFALAHYRRGEALMLAGRTTEAETAFRRALDEDVCPLRAPKEIVDTLRRVMGDMGVPLVDLPHLLAERSRRQHGHAALGNEEFLDHVHLAVWVHELLGDELAQQVLQRGWLHVQHVLNEDDRRRIEDAVTSELNPHDYALKDLKLAKVLGWSGKHDEALEVLLRARDQLDGEPEFHYNLGILLARQGRYEEALAEYQRVLDGEPGHFPAQFHAGRALAALERFNEAVTAFRRALALDPDHAESEFRLALNLWRDGRPDQALLVIETLEQRQPEYDGLRELRGWVLLELGRSEEAVALLQASGVESSPELHYRVGISKLKRDDRAGAEAEMRAALAEQPDYVPAIRVLAQILETMGRDRDAVAAYGRAIEHAPGDAQLRYELGALHQQRGRLDLAGQCYLQALERDAGHARAWSNLGAVLMQQNDVARATAAFERAVSLDANEANAHYNLAQLKLAAGDRAGARRHMLRAEELGLEPSAALRRAIEKGR